MRAYQDTCSRSDVSLLSGVSQFLTFDLQQSWSPHTCDLLPILLIAIADQILAWQLLGRGCFDESMTANLR